MAGYKLLRFSAGLIFASVAAVAASAQAWSALADMPTARAQATVATTPSGNIYVLGGYAGGAAFSSVDIFNTNTNTWSAGPAMPVATRGAAAVYSNNFIYVFGGYDSTQRAIYQALDLSNNTWTQGTFSNGGWEATAGAANGKIIIVGGENSEWSTFEFNPSSGTFTTLANNPNRSRGGQAVTIGTKLYLVGAEGAGSNYDPPSTILDLYDPSTDTWSTAPADQALARAQFAAGADGRYIYVAGGSSALGNISSPYYTSFMIYDSVTDAWSTGTSLPVGLRETVGAVVNGKFYVFGGFDNGAVSNDVYAIAVPEPSTYALTGLGAWLIWFGRRRRVA